MKKTDTWMPLYIGDYLADTSRLTTEQHGAYLLLLMDYWRNGPPPDDEAVLASIVKLPLPAWRKHAAALRGFFHVEDGLWLQGRAEAERAKANGVSDTRRTAGKAGAEKRWANSKSGGKADGKPIANAIANASQSPLQNDAPSQSQTQEITPRPPAGVAPLKPKASKRCPAEFLVTGELQRWAREKAPLVDIRAETEAFRDWEFRTAKLDWPATWRIWMSKEQKRLAEKRPPNGAITDVGFGLETLAERARRERIAELTGGLASRQPTQPPGPPLPAFDPPETFDAIAHVER